MKILFFLIFTLLLSSSAFASQSLEDIFKSQDQVTISPVEINDIGFLASDIIRGSGSICNAIGYTRVVSYEVIKCGVGEKINFANALRGATVITEKTCGEFSEKFKSLTFAR